MKSVLIFGYGKTGQSLAKYFQNKDVLCYIYNDSPIEGSTYGAKLYENQNIDLIIKSPGISYSHDFLQKMMDQGVPIEDELEYAAKKIRGRILAITGTNGKSTTCDLLYHILKSEHESTFLAGNFGTALINFVDESKEEDFYVVECSSYQLERSTHIPVDSCAILNLTEDHLLRHHTMQAYLDAKKNVYASLKEDGLLVLYADDEYLQNITGNFYIQKFSKEDFKQEIYYDGEYIWYRQKKFISKKECILQADHNMLNMMCAILLAKHYEIDEQKCKEVLRSYRGLSHRYEVLGVKNARRWINDSKATNPNSTIPALLNMKENTVLILGGMEKESDFTEMYSLLNEKIRAIVLLGETQERLYQELKEVGHSAFRCDTLEKATKKALELSKEGDDILLSPACASWDLYKDFEERGDHFRRLFGELNE